jgi:hypothetical protein
MMGMNKFMLILTSLIFISSALWSADLSATIKEVNGKVEAKINGGAWAPVKVGDILKPGDSISTGFKSKAVLALGNTSVLVANELTRLSLAELMEKEGTVTTDLFLDVGNIRTEVHSSNEVSNNFQVRNANSTASVRGTVLDVEILGDGAGMKVMAWDGMALVTDIRTGRQAQVGEQKKKKVQKSKADESTEETADEEASTDEDSGDAAEGDAATDLGMPSEPPAEIAAAPLMASGSGGGMVSSMASALASATVTVSTKPPAPGSISTGGGASASTETAAAVSAVTEALNSTAAVVNTLSNVSIQIIWPQ